MEAEINKIIHECKRIRRIREKEIKAEAAKSVRAESENTELLKSKISRDNSGWKPQKGYIGSKEIVNSYGIPRSTLQGWAERDKQKSIKDPQTQEVYYKKKWFEGRYKKYKSRKSNS